jgi:hypothetical protein
LWVVDGSDFSFWSISCIPAYRPETEDGCLPSSIQAIS